MFAVFLLHAPYQREGYIILFDRTEYGVLADDNATSGWDSWYKLWVILCVFSAVQGYCTSSRF